MLPYYLQDPIDNISRLVSDANSMDIDLDNAYPQDHIYRDMQNAVLHEAEELTNWYLREEHPSQHMFNSILAALESSILLLKGSGLEEMPRQMLDNVVEDARLGRYLVIPEKYQSFFDLNYFKKLTIR